MSPYKACRRARHLLLHFVITVTDVGQAHLADCDEALVESRNTQRLRQKVCRLLGGWDVLQSNLPTLHHMLQPSVASLHVLEVALEPQVLCDYDGQLVVHVQHSRLPSVEQPELCKEKVKATSLLAGFHGCDVLRLSQRERRAFDALARPGDCGPSKDQHIAARAHPILLVASVVGVRIANQIQRLWSTAEIQSCITGVGQVVQTSVDLVPVVVAPHCQAAPQLDAREGNVRPRRRCRELQRPDLLSILLFARLRVLVVGCQLCVSVDGDRRLRHSPGLLLVDETLTQLIDIALLYAAHQLNLQPRVSLPETSPTLLWTGKVGDASAFRVWGSRAFVRDLSADKLSPRAVPCVFLGFPPDAPGWQFYHPTSRRVLSSQDVTFDESVPYYRLFPYRTASLPPPPLFLAPGPPPVDPLPPQGPAPSGVSQVDAVEPVEVAVDSGAAPGAEPAGAGSGGAESGGAETWGAEPVGAEPGGAEPGGAEPGGAATGGAEPGGAELAVTEPGGAEPGGTGSARVASGGASSRREVLSPQELCEWFARRWSRAAGAGGSPATTGPGGAGATGPGGAAEAAGVGPAGGSAGVSGSTGAAGSAGPAAAGATGVGAAWGVGAGGSADTGPSEGTGAGAAGAGGATGAGTPAGSPGAVLAGSGGASRPRPYFVPLLEQVLGLPPSPSPAPPLECPQPVQSQSLLQPVSPLPAPSPYTGPTGGLAERRAPASRPASPARPACTSRPRPPAVPGTHQMALRPSTAPLRVPLPSPPATSLHALPDPESDSLRAASPTVARFLATVVTDPSLASTAASALVAELVDFAASCRLDYAASLVAESASVCPPSVGDPDAPDIPTPQSYAEAIEGPYSSQWQAAMDAEMASWKSTVSPTVHVGPEGVPILRINLAVGNRRLPVLYSVSSSFCDLEEDRQEFLQTRFSCEWGLPASCLSASESLF
ncbi:unnamed protein product [Closterium sp. NIES-54]